MSCFYQFAERMRGRFAPGPCPQVALRGSMNMIPDNSQKKMSEPIIEEETAEEAEWAALTALLREAYPAPEKGSICANVMAQIHGETVAQTKPSRKVQVRTWFRRYGTRIGGMAACAALLCSTLFLVYPRLNRVADREVAGTGNADTAVMVTEAVPEMAAVTEEAVEAGQAVGYSLYSDEDAEMEEEAAVVEESVVDEGAARVQTYSATSLLKSVSRYATVEDDVSTDAADDSSLVDGFLHYLLAEGCFTKEEYQAWLATRESETVWSPEELCVAFGLDAGLYDTWLRK